MQRIRLRAFIHYPFRKFSYQSIRYAIHFHPHPFSFNLMPHFQRFFFWRLAKFLMIIQKFRNQ